jgi:hypothetical protein
MAKNRHEYNDYDPNNHKSMVRWPSGLRRQLKVVLSGDVLIRWSERAWVQIPLSSTLFFSHVCVCEEESSTGVVIGRSIFVLHLCNRSCETKISLR